MAVRYTCDECGYTWTEEADWDEAAAGDDEPIETSFFDADETDRTVACPACGAEVSTPD